MKRSSIIIVLLLVSLLLLGCSNSKNTVVSNGKRVNVSKMKHKHCTREGDAGSDIDVSLNYDLYYTGDILNILKAEEKITSKKEDSLSLYEDSYKKIHENYKGLEYYDTSVVRDDKSVTSTIVINYDKINMKKLLEIEGEEDNIIDDNKAKVDKWLELAQKFGTKCKEVEEENE